MEDSVIQGLLRPQAYPERTSEVQLRQTHVSFLFMTDTHVYKIKKPVDFGFLNFTTLDRRRFYCNEEVRLNRRLCPDVYLGVVEVRESVAGYGFFNEGVIIDYAVKMKRLPEERMLHRLVQEKAVTPGDMRRVGQTIARFHSVAEQSDVIAAYGEVGAIRYNWEENFHQIAPFVDTICSSKDLELVKRWGDLMLAEHGSFFTARVSGGYIRDCDGDLHLDNICLTDQVCIFDCIEFNSRFRFSDTCADIAFLLMDLDYHGRSDLAEEVLDEYVTVSGDRGCLRLLPFYKTYRALVRAKVESFRLKDPLMSETEKAEALKRAANYFLLARRYVIQDKLPLSLVMMCGLMGSGKSTIAAALSAETGMEVSASDRVRKELAAVPEHLHDFSPYGEGIYGPGADRATYDALLNKGKEELSRGRSIIIDATFRRAADRRKFRSLAREHGACCCIVIATCPEQVARERLDHRMQQEGEVSDGRWELYHRQQKEFEPPEPDEASLIFVDTSKSINDSIGTILEQMGLFS